MIKGVFLERYISAHAIMMSFEGTAIYFNSLFLTSNYLAKFVITEIIEM